MKIKVLNKIAAYFKYRKPDTWELPADSKKGIDDKIADFILGQADKALAYTLDVADKTTNRTYAVIVLVIPITSTMIGLLVKELHQPGNLRDNHKINLYAILALLCIVVLVLLLGIVLPRMTMGSGRGPKDLAHENMLQNEHTSDRKLLLFKLNEIKNVQYKIDYNDSINQTRIFRFKLALLILCIGFISFAMIYATLV